MQLSAFNVVPSRETVGGETTRSLIERSQARFEQVIEDHAGTPWAARAQIELKRGFGFELSPQYVYAGPKKPVRRGPPRPPPKRPQVTVPIPKL